MVLLVVEVVEGKDKDIIINQVHLLAYYPAFLFFLAFLLKLKLEQTMA